MKKRVLWKWVRISAAVLFLLTGGLAFSGLNDNTPYIFSLQLGPVLMKCAAAFSAGSFFTAFVILLIAFLFGRFYCAAFCPVGIFQDMIGFLSRRKGRIVPNFIKLRYGIAGLAFGLLFCGWNTIFLWLDPYSMTGRIVVSFSVGSVIPLLIVAGLTVWKKRIYCTALCPVGTVLGLAAKYGVFRLTIRKQCVKCGICVKVCPAGCIDPQAGMLDNERCVRCMNCISSCPVDAVHFVLRKRKSVPVDPSRRAFLINGAVLAAGVAGGMILAKTGIGKFMKFSGKTAVLPPGGDNLERFAAKCTACQLCTVNCPAKIIVSAPGGTGPVSLDLNKGFCQYDCNRCSQFCPTGAIRPLTLEMKRKTKIAEARFNPGNCIVFQEGAECGLCADVCPVRAITLRKNGSPRPVDTSRCIGCGACHTICPAPEKAMTIHSIKTQTTLEI